MKHLRSFIIGLLSISLFFATLSEHVLAINSDLPDISKQEAVIVGEVTEKRDEYSKTFLLSDRTEMIAVYDEPIHVKGSTGQWDDIDNSFSIINADDPTDVQILQNNRGKFTVKFSRNTQNRNLVSTTINTYPLKWDFVNANKVFAEVLVGTNPTYLTSDDAYLNLKNKQSQVIYRDLFPNVDVRYTLSSLSLKEDIILKNQFAQNTFVSEYQLGELIAIQKDSQTIVLIDPDQPDVPQIILSAPLMSDASGRFNLDVQLKIVSQDNGKMILQTIVDSDWLNDPSTIYPVTVDPTTYTSQDISKISDTFVSSWKPNTAFYSMGSTWVGREGANYGTCRILIKYPTLPLLGNGDKVISAKLNMLQDVSGFSSGGPSTLQLNLHEITEDWDLTTTTWNTNVEYDTDIISDYFITSSAYNVEYNTWDITQLVQSWYDGTKINNGVMIKSTDAFEAGTLYARNKYVGTGYGIDGLYPSLQITYINTNGLEDLWTYTTQDMGRAGLALVNNNTGFLTLMRDDLAIAGGKLPVSITSFYNYDPKATGERYSWKTNYNQTIGSTSIGGSTYYKYLDGDGTTVYFYSLNGQWIDELGKGLTLTIDTGSTTARYVITDKNKNKLEFNSTGYLMKLKDFGETVNEVEITYAGSLIDYIKDSSERKYDFTYTNGFLTKIEYLGTGSTVLRTVSYTYDSNAKTMTVTYPDTNTVTYYYDTEHKITKAEDSDGSSVLFTYLGSPKIITSMTEYGTDEVTTGNEYAFSYQPNETSITDKYDQTVYYQFDNYGRTIGIKDINNAAQYYQYGASGGEKNKLTSVSKLQTTTVNLAKNISFETTSDWAQSDTSGLLTTPIYSTTDKLFGANSLTITHDGTAERVIKAYENIPVTLDQETNFTVSAYVKSNAVGVAHVSLVGGSATSIDIAVDEANVWQRISATITVPQTVTSLQIQLVVDGAAIVYFDGIQLEEGLGVNRYNLVENPSLEEVSGTLPVGWSGSGTSSSVDFSTSTACVFGSMSYQISGNALTDKTLDQTIAVSGIAGDVFSFGGWAKANAAPSGASRSFHMSLTFNNTDATTTVVSVPFNNSSTSWQYVEGKAVATKTYNSVTIKFEYKKQLNTVTFDGAQLYREEFGQTFSYDANGNLLSAKDLEGNTDLTTYDQSNQLLSQINADGTYVAYDYDNFQRVTAALSSTGVSTKITYDQYGNPTSTSISSDVFMKKLIAYYDFDGDVEDKSGNNHDATSNSGTFVDGKVGSAIRFDGSTQYAELGYFKVPDTFSVSMWVKNERFSANECIIGKNTSEGYNQLLIGEYNSTLTVDIGGLSYALGTKTLGYHFITAIYTKINDTTTNVVVYKDLIKIYDANIAKAVGDTSTGKPWALGMEWDSNNKSDFFQGSIDELAFYEGALELQEIETIYEQANTKQLIAKYDFTGASGTSVPDVTKNGHHATVVGGATFSNGQLVLNGSTGYMQLDDFTIGNSLSVAMTVKADVVKNAALFAKHTTAGSNILVSGYYGGWEMNVRGNIKNQGTMLANTSYTVVYTINQINATQSVIQVYVNGSPIYPENYTINTLLGNTSGKAWVIGQEWDSSTASDFFDGTIDNIQIYNYALTADEVSENTTALTNGTYDPDTPVNSITWDKRITSSATYTTDGNYITSVTDSRGNTANYSYDTTFGRLNNFRAPGEAAGEATTYTYVANTDRLEKVEKTVDSKTYTNSYTYVLDKLTKITHNGFDYEFTYDIFGNPHQIKVAGNTLITNIYQANNGLLDTLTYGNGAVVDYDYDSYHRVIAKKINTVLKFEYAHDHQGNLARTVEHIGTSTVTTTYVYDFMNRLTKMVSSNGNTLNYHYDTFGRVDVLSNRLGSSTYTHSYVYGDATKEGEIPGLIYTVKLNGTTRLSYDFDQLARLSSRTITTTTPYTTTYTYLDGSGTASTTTLLASLTNGSNPAYSYTYDASGNIRTIMEGSTLKAEYTYDKMNQLIREDSAYSGKSIDYTYDVGGNITSKTIYAYTGGVRGALEDTIVYGYTNAWKDKLTSYDGQSLLYDAIGNPTTYRDNLSFTWANGRELATVINNGVNGSFTYNDSGIRTSKTYNGATTSYLLNGSSIVRQTQGESTLDFFYDQKGNLYGFQKGTSTYFYLHNGQNDIVGILDSTGTQVVSYTYDAWGNQQPISGSLATTIGQENPFRYRGYYFDTETGLYYLNSRYYDSVTGRFINADGLISASSTLLGTNMYAYCENNPVSKFDPSGEIAIMTLIAIVSITIGVITAVYTYTETAKYNNGKGDVGASIYNGLCAGLTVYSMGTSLYGLYVDLCYATGNAPVTDIGTSTPPPTVHGNSAASTKTQHGYEISETKTGDVVKTGISGQPLNANGTSPRANSQVNDWNRNAGYIKYEAEVVVQNMPSRQVALYWERYNAARLFELGNSLSKHIRPKP